MNPAEATRAFLRKALNVLEYPELLNALTRHVDRGFVKQLLCLKKTYSLDPATILDIGAAKGEFTKAARFVFPDSTIYAFEPIKEFFLELVKVEQSHRHIHTYNLALGSENEVAGFKLNEFPYSSSLLEMTERHRKMYPFAQSTKEIPVDCRRLDSVKDISLKSPVFVKIDVQGAELQVLRGAGELVKSFDVVQLEVNFEIFYRGQATFAQVFEFMSHKGFSSFLQQRPRLSENGRGGPVWCDLVFFR